MEESTVATATADVMIYDDATKKWLSPDGCTEPSRSLVRILHNINTNAFRIVGTRLQDKQWILNCNIYEKLRYKSATPTFHQWRDEKRKVYGLSFLQEEEARIFVKVMSQALALLTSSNDYQNGSELGSSNGIYQEPHHLHHNAHSAPSFRENDEESVYSSGLFPQNINNSRKSSQSMQQQASSAVGQAMLQMNSNARRASQGSSSSSNASSLPPSIYATTSGSNCTSTNSPSRHLASSAPNNNNNSNSTPSPTLSSTNIAMVCTNAPPAPPPPPPSIWTLNANKNTGNSIAEQLKKVQLRKTSVPASTNLTGAIASRGRDDLFSELEATLNKRKNQFDNSDSRSLGDKDLTASNGTSIRRPWERQVNGAASSTESPKLQRKLPSGSQIVQEDVRSVNDLPNSNCSSVGTSGLTVEMLEKWKDGLLIEIRKEIEKAKAEIVEALRMELKR